MRLLHGIYATVQDDTVTCIGFAIRVLPEQYTRCLTTIIKIMFDFISLLFILRDFFRFPCCGILFCRNLSYRILSYVILSYVLRHFVLCDFVLHDFVLCDFVLWDFVVRNFVFWVFSALFCPLRFRPVADHPVEFCSA